MKKNELKFRSRTFMLELYPDWDNIEIILDLIQTKYDYALILHDKDDCKPHYHVFIRVPNAIWNTSLCNDLHIDFKWCQQVRSTKSALQYLIHFNNSDKYQYNLNEVRGTLTKILKKYIEEDVNEPFEIILIILDFIDKHDNFLPFASLYRFVLNEGYYGYYRADHYSIIRYLDEHNKYFIK